MNFKTNEELREIWESGSINDSDDLFELMYEVYQIEIPIECFKTSFSKDLDDLIKDLSDNIRNWIASMRPFSWEFDKKKPHKYKFIIDDYCDGWSSPHCVLYQRKDFEDFISSYEIYKTRILKREEEEKKKMEKKREKDYLNYLKFKEACEREG